MILNHVHLSVRDLDLTVRWIKEVWRAEPSVSSDQMAIVTFGAFTVIFDKADADTKATLGFESRDCDADYQAVVGRGAVPIEAPANRPWGTRSAYLHGPGAITFEIEQLSA